MDRKDSLDTWDSPHILPSGSPITGTLIWYYNLCHREVWLMGHQICPDEDHELLDLGRAVHKTHYKRETKELGLEGVKIDVVKASEGTICEVKTSSRYLDATKMQLAYYIYRLKVEGVESTGEILVPKENKKIDIQLDKPMEKELCRAFKKIAKIIGREKPPKAKRKKYCKKCSYREYCWA